MGALNVTGVLAVSFPVDTTVTAPGGDYIAKAYTWHGVPQGVTSMTVLPNGIALCMLAANAGASELSRSKPFMTVDEVRTSGGA